MIKWLVEPGWDMKKYQVRPDYIADMAWARGYLKPLGLLRIAAWTTGQGLGSLTLNSEKDIEERTGAAVDRIRPWRGRQVVGLSDPSAWSDWRETARGAIGVQATNAGLLGLKGVGYPMASAILDILDPQVWPVIDKYAVRTVFGAQPDGTPWPSARWHRAAAYEAYARHLANLGATHWGSNLSIHKLDQRLWEPRCLARNRPLAGNPQYCLRPDYLACSGPVELECVSLCPS